MFLSFEEARAIVRSKGFQSRDEFTGWEDRPSNIPGDPSKVYAKSGWRSWGDWLGTGTISTRDREFLRFEEARAIVRSKGFQNVDEYNAWKDRPLNIPSNPWKTYAGSGWLGSGDWLGVHNIWRKSSIFAFVSSLVRACRIFCALRP